MKGRTWLALSTMLLTAACGSDSDSASRATATATASLTVAPTTAATAVPATATEAPSATHTATLAPPTHTASATLTASASATATPTESPLPTATATEGPLQVLLFTYTAGFRHASIADAIRVMTGLPSEERMAVTHTEDPAMFSDAELARFDVVMFANTTGDVLDGTQQAAMERYIRGGGGYVGVHSAADTEYGWPWYGRLVGAYFVSHPLLPVEVEVTAEDRSHPSTAHFPSTFRFTDEWYNFDRNPRFDNVILLTVDEEGFIFPNIPPGPSMGDDHPVAWYKEFEGGRSFYTNLGHRPETWDDPAFRTHLLEGIRWAAGTVQYNRIVLSRKASNPLALAVAPDGRVFYIERTGELRVWLPSSGAVLDAAVLEVDTEFENGLLGIALDPGFADNSQLYLYHSEPVPDPPPASGPPGENVLSRFTLRPDSTLDLDSRVDLLRVPSERQCCHEGGSLAFAPDGTLYLSTGDNTDPFGDAMGFAPLDERPGRERFDSRRTAANPFDLRGKILRINSDGTVPAGNLFPPDGSAGRPEIYVMGCRNPFRIAVDSVSGRLFWGDVGPDAVNDAPRGPRGYDEINFADQPGNYGWPYCIGPNVPYADWDYATGTPGALFDCAGLTPPVLAYDYLTVSELALGNAITTENNQSLPGLPFSGRLAIAGTFYRAPSAAAPYALPAPFDGTLLMTEWARDVIAAVELDGGELQRVLRFLPFERFLRPIDLEVGPDGALYVLEFGSGYFGDNLDAALSRVEFSAEGLLSPAATVRAAPTAGRAPLTVQFSADGSRAPGRDPGIASYEWDAEGDGVVDASGPTFEHTYTANGVYRAALTVVGRSGRRSAPTVNEIVVGNSPPQVTILAPEDGATVAAGSMVQLRGSAADVEDGTAACSDLTWEIRLGHNAHSHPLTTLSGCEATFFAGLSAHAQGDLFYAIELRYTDRGGSSDEPALTGRQGIRIEVEPGP